MRSETVVRVGRLVRALAARAAAVAMALAVLLLAASHVEIDHGSRFAPPAGQQTASLTASACPSAALGHAGSVAAECSAPCVAPLPNSMVSEATLVEPSSSIPFSRPALDGAHVGFVVPPPRIV